jgi:protein-S-isoprenylcysteine O-methyltransferase Ste14
MLFFKLIAWTVLNTSIYAGLLLLPAGTLDWWRAWVFIGVAFIAIAAMALNIFASNEGLLDERLKSPLQRGQPLADKIVLLLCLATWGGLIAFISLDRFHLHLAEQPRLLVSSAGLVFVVFGWRVVYLSFRENAFAASVVRHQEERHHTVIETGVYGVVRHPLYAGGVLIWAGMSLWLQSYAAALLAIVPVAAIALRILVEERFLRRELKGYEAYTQRVRYRLIPLLW